MKLYKVEFDATQGQGPIHSETFVITPKSWTQSYMRKELQKKLAKQFSVKLGRSKIIKNCINFGF